MNLRDFTIGTRLRIGFGGILLILAVGAPMLTLEVGFAQPAHPVAALSLAALAVVSLIALVLYERKHPQPMFPMRVLAPIESRLLNGIAVMSDSPAAVLAGTAKE